MSSIKAIFSKRISLQVCAFIALAGGVASLHGQSAAASGAVAPTTLSTDQVIAQGEALAGRSISFDGLLLSVCQHGGRKGFFKDPAGQMSGFLRVDIGEGAKPFAQDNKGEIIRVTGVLREKRIDAAALDQWESQVRAQASHKHEKAEACAHSCPEAKEEQTEQALANIAKYRSQLANNAKGYLSSFSFEATSWEIVTDSHS